MKKVLVIMGGTSSEREISLKTGEQIYKNLDREKYIVSKLVINENSDIFKLLDMKDNIDFVYIALHGAFGEDGSIQAILDTMGIKYSGPGALTSSICMDKNICKSIVKDFVNVIPGISMKKDNILPYEKAIEYGDRLVLKAVNGGSSLGLYVVDNKKDYQKAIENIFKMSSEIVLEKFITGTEISVPVIGGRVYPTVKITPLKSEVFDYEAKYSIDGAKEEVYRFEDKIQNQIDTMSKIIYDKINCNAFCRIDYIIDKNDIVYMIEVNTLPGMTQTSLLPKSLLSLGIDYVKALDLLIEASI